MARKKKNEMVVESLMLLPWWVSVVMGCIVYITMRWIVPSAFANSPILQGLASLSRSFAWLALLAFGFIAAIAFVRLKLLENGHHDFSDAKLASRPKSKTSINSPSKKDALTSKTSIQVAWGNDTSKEVFTTWTLEALRALEWKRFELLCAMYYEIVGFKSETIRCGADGGIDVKLFKVDPNKPLAVVQCKAWNAYTVGVKEIRELLGVMVHEKVTRGVFITTGTFTKDALKFGAANPIQLLDGAGFVMKIKELSQANQDALLQYAFEGDYQTPTCASCGIKMMKRDGKRG